jgi:hypothetical protein
MYCSNCGSQKAGILGDIEYCQKCHSFARQSAAPGFLALRLFAILISLMFLLFAIQLFFS